MGQILSGEKTAARKGAPRAFPSILLVILLLSLAPVGCSKKPVRPEEPRPEYSKVLDKETRSAKIYSGLDAILFMTATYKTMEFREAYVDLYVKGYEVDQTYREALLQRARDDNDKYNEIFFTAYTPETKWNDFDRRDSVWRLYLEDSEGNRLIPVSVTRVDAGDPLVKRFFPYFDPWSSGYLVRFPKYSVTGTEPIPGPKTEFLKLVVTGILGRGEIEWPLND
ncbi:MAG: hypothetical protein HY891_07515 [Deltaproteobacteria bacterium]|nr:hypothetical protein [Deltaproteobacteria bacterium]